jgi:hypothetical protein
MLFDIRHMTAPDNENNLQPFGGQGPERLIMAMTTLALLPVISQGPGRDACATRKITFPKTKTPFRINERGFLINLT